MHISRKIQILSIVFLLSAATFAQTAEIEKTVKQSKFRVQLEQSLNDATALKLPENRALVYARLGKLYWKFDQNRARQLFQKSIDELIKAQNEAELDKKNASRRNDLLIFGQTRQKILDIIIYLDADLAFDSFIRSRSATTKDAFAGISNEPPVSTYNGKRSDELIVERENMLEQRLAESVADKNPDRAVSILSDIVRKNNSYNTVELLEKIRKKDQAIAEVLFKETIQKILAADFSKNSAQFQLANRILFESTRESFVGNALKSDVVALRKLAEKTADFLIREADRNAEFTVTDITPTLVKILPERADELKQKTVSRRRSSFDIFPINKQASELLSSDASPEKLLSEADKFPPAFRERIYVAAVNKVALAGDVNRAREILIKNFPVRQRDEMFAALNKRLASRAIEKGEFDKASDLIEQLPENSRFEVLINLAESIIIKSPKDTQKALSILGKARDLISNAPANSSEIYKMGQLAAVYALIEPKTGFNLLDRIMKKIVRVSEAEAIIKDFRGDSYIHQDEFVIILPILISGFSQIEFSLDKLTKIDFEKTIEVINKIPRRDVRMAFQLEVLEKGWELNFR